MPDPEMARRGRIGALVTNGRHNGTAITARARQAFIAAFAEQARIEAAANGETITEAEAARRGEFLRRAHYSRLALRSARARARRVA